MPHTRVLLEEGIFRQMRSTVPEISSVAWSSMITGTNPGVHGIFGFMDLFEGSYRMRFPNFRDLRAEPFWREWPGESVIINVPSTYPVEPMEGVHISGFVSVDMARSVHPAGLLDKLTEMDYRLDVDSQKAHSSMALFLSDLNKTLEARIRASRYLWDHVDWRTFMLVFTGTDRLMHFLWNAYEDERHVHHDFFLDHFRRIDEAVGEFCARMNDTDLLVMHSDHGFERLDWDIQINHVLKEAGFLAFEAGEEEVLRNIHPTSRAFALEPGRVYVHRRGKYPRGCVDDEADTIMADLEQVFSRLEVEGRKVIRDVYRAEDIYSGPQVEHGPDLVLVGAEGFNLRATMKARVLAERGIFTGKHTQDNAFLLVRPCGGEADLPEWPEISEVRTIIETMNPALAGVCGRRYA